VYNLPKPEERKMEMSPAAKGVCADHTEFCVRLARIEDKIETILSALTKKEAQEERERERQRNLVLEREKIGLTRIGVVSGIVGTIVGLIVKFL
jgi:hypothetical protein